MYVNVKDGLKMIRWILPPFLAFFLMMIYAGVMGKEGLQQYPIGDPRLLWEEYLIIMFICYLYVIVRRILPRNGK